MIWSEENYSRWGFAGGNQEEFGFGHVVLQVEMLSWHLDTWRLEVKRGPTWKYHFGFLGIYFKLQDRIRSPAEWERVRKEFGVQ